MSSIFMPMSRGSYAEIVLNDETDDLADVIIGGVHYDPMHMFNPLAVALLDFCMEQKRLIKRGLVSDVTKMNEREFCDAKLLKARF